MVPTLPSSKSSVLRRSLYRRELQEGRAYRETAQKARGSPALLTDSKEIPVFSRKQVDFPEKQGRD
jgi:hypothetical protein